MKQSQMSDIKSDHEADRYNTFKSKTSLSLQTLYLHKVHRCMIDFVNNNVSEMEIFEKGPMF